MHEALSTVGSYALETMAPILAALAGMLLIKALRWAGLKVDEATARKIDSVAYQAMQFVDQWVRAKAKLGQPKPSQEEMAAKALEYGRKLLGKRLPGDFSERVEAQLGFANKRKDL